MRPSPCRPVSPLFLEDSWESSYASATAELRRRVCSAAASPRRRGPGDAGSPGQPQASQPLAGPSKTLNPPPWPLYGSADGCRSCRWALADESADDGLGGLFREDPAAFRVLDPETLHPLDVARGFDVWRSAEHWEAACSEDGYSAKWGAGVGDREPWEVRDRSWLQADVDGGLEDREPWGIPDHSWIPADMGGGLDAREPWESRGGSSLPGDVSGELGSSWDGFYSPRPPSTRGFNPVRKFPAASCPTVYGIMCMELKPKKTYIISCQLPPALQPLLATSECTIFARGCRAWPPEWHCMPVLGE